MVTEPVQSDGESEMQRSLRDDIALSWRRSMLSGLKPYDSFHSASVAETDQQSRLMVATGPILDRLEEDLAGTRYCVFLADRDARLVDIRAGQSRIRDTLEDDGAVVGRLFTEEHTGTNAIATVHETRQPLAVHGDEHFFEAVKKYSCYGYPITHLTTHRLEGVLDFTFLSEDDNSLLKPMLIHAVENIQRRLLEGARSSEIALLAAYQEAVSKRRRGTAITGIGEDVFFANSAAQQLLEPVDHAVLRALSEQPATTGTSSASFTLNSGVTVEARWSRVAPRAGVIVTLEETKTESTAGGPRAPRVPRTLSGKLAAARSDRSSVLITGEQGVGKTHALQMLSGDHPINLICATDLIDTPAGTWIDVLRSSLREPTTLTAVDDFDLLPAAIGRRAAELLVDSNGWWAVTTAPASVDSLEHSRMLPHCRVQLALPPLRARGDELPELVRALLADLSAEPSLRLSPAAMHAVVEYQWPGNLNELASVLRAAVQRRSTGDISVTDLALPTWMPPRGGLTPLQLAERDAIERELDKCDGNKLAAAKNLGISRTTLYKRMAQFGILG